MNLLVSCGAFHPAKGGAESLFFDLSAELARRGHRVTVLTRHFPGLRTSEEVAGFRIEREDWPVDYEERQSRPRFLARSPSALWRTLRRLRRLEVQTVAIGLLDMSAIYLMAARRFSNFRLVTYLHGAEIRDLPQMSRNYARMLERCLATSDAVVAVSRSLAEDSLRLHPSIADKLSVIANGIDTEALARVEPAERERPYILYSGRLAAEKRVDCIVRAFARAADRIPGVDLVIAGGGPEEGALREQIARSGSVARRIAMVGNLGRTEALGLLKSALFLVLASEKESHSMVTLEAFSAGKPVIASRVVGMQEMIEEGVNGATFPVGDDVALADLMVRYASDSQLRGSVEARLEERRGSFDLHSKVDAHLQVLRA